MILTAYLDESGTHDGSPVTVFGGVLANAQQWARFEADFRGLKEKHGFAIFHTKKFKKKAGDFSGWTNSQCLSLMRDLAMLTNSAFTEGVTMVVDNAEFETDYKGGENPRKLRLDSKYGLCFRQCLLFFVLEALKRVYRKKLPKLNIVLESGHPNVGDAIRIFKEFAKELRTLECNILDCITVKDKDDCDPLMIADFLAHTAFMSEIQARSDEPVPRGTPSLPKLTALREVPRGHTGVTHLDFKPDGLASVKAGLLEDLRTKNASSSRVSRWRKVRGDF